MKHSSASIGAAAILVVAASLLAACGGTKVLREPQPIHAQQALAAAEDTRVAATLDWVIVRDGAGTWARNADWDEYLVRVRNVSGTPISITQLTVVDSLGAVIAPETRRKSLVKGSKKTSRRYKDSGLKVKAGQGAGTILVAGAAVTAFGVGAATAVAYGSLASGAATAGTAGAAVGGLLLLGPALAVGGVLRAANNSEVNKQIELRQSALPVVVAAGETRQLDMFFPLAPSPRALTLHYTDADGERTLPIDTSSALNGLHMEARHNGQSTQR